MKESALPTPGVGSKSQHLRRIAANAISALEVTAPKYTLGNHPSAAGLKAFFDACSAAAAEIGKNDAILVFASPSYTLAPAATAQTTLNKGGSAGAATYSTSNAAVATINASGLITAVAAGTCTITVNVAATATYRAGTASFTVTVA